MSPTASSVPSTSEICLPITCTTARHCERLPCGVANSIPLGIEWSRERIANSMVRERSYSRCGNPRRYQALALGFDEKSFYLILNMAVGGTLGGEVVPEDLPATVEFDWIRVYAEGCKAGLLSP